MVNTMNRDNEPLFVSLWRGGDQRDLALSELRIALTRNLRKAFSDDAHADESFLEDVVQDSLLRILDRLDQFEGRSQFLTWATSIAIRVAMTELRRHRWRDVSLEEVIGDGVSQVQWASKGTLDPDNQIERTEILEKMLEVIETQLTEKQRTALLAEIRGMPQEELARHLGSNRNAIYKLTHDARKKVKRALEAAGYGTDDVHAVFAK